MAQCFWLDFWDEFRARLGRTAIIVSITAVAVVGTLAAADAWYANSCIRWGKQVCGSHHIFKTFVRKYHKK